MVRAGGRQWGQGREGADRGEGGGWGGAYRRLSGALLRPSQPRVREAFWRALKWNVCQNCPANITLPPLDTIDSTDLDCLIWETVIVKTVNNKLDLKNHDAKHFPCLLVLSHDI